MGNNKELNTKKQCDIHVVIGSVLCIDDNCLSSIKKGNIYKLLKEGDFIYSIIRDDGRRGVYLQERFKKL